MLKTIYLPEDIDLDSSLSRLRDFAKEEGFSIESDFKSILTLRTLKSKITKSEGDNRLDILVVTSRDTKFLRELIMQNQDLVLIVINQADIPIENSPYFHHLRDESQFVKFLDQGLKDVDVVARCLGELPTFMDTTSSVQNAGDENIAPEDIESTHDDEIEVEVDASDVEEGTSIKKEQQDNPVEPTETEVALAQQGDNKDFSFSEQKVIRNGTPDDLIPEYVQIKQQRVGVWSPVHRTGVSTFIQSFAFYMAESRYNIVVMESLTKRYKLLDTLLRFDKKPSSWSSIVNAVHGKTNYSDSLWVYKGVIFLPLDSSYKKYDWSDDHIERYYKTPKAADLQLIDIPSGELSESEERVFDYIDELWIMADDSYHEFITWKEVIKEYQSKYNLSIKIIFNKTHEYSNSELISNSLSIPILESLPDLYSQVMKNHYLSVPVYYMDDVESQYSENFIRLQDYLSSITKSNEQSVLSRKKLKNRVVSKPLDKDRIDQKINSLLSKFLKGRAQ